MIKVFDFELVIIEVRELVVTHKPFSIIQKCKRMQIKNSPNYGESGGKKGKKQKKK